MEDDVSKMNFSQMSKSLKRHVIPRRIGTILLKINKKCEYKKKHIRSVNDRHITSVGMFICTAATCFLLHFLTYNPFPV